MSGDTRRRVLEAARRTFAARGFSGASTRAIAAEAGVSAMALYNYAPSKAALFAAVWAESLERVYAGYAEAVAGKDSLGAELDALIERSRQVLADDPGHIRFVVRVLIERDHPDLAGVQLPVEPAATFLRGLADRSVARGEIAREDRGRLIDFVVTLFYGLTSVTAADPAGLDRAVDAMRWAARRFVAGTP